MYKTYTKKSENTNYLVCSEPTKFSFEESLVSQTAGVALHSNFKSHVDLLRTDYRDRSAKLHLCVGVLLNQRYFS